MRKPVLFFPSMPRVALVLLSSFVWLGQSGIATAQEQKDQQERKPSTFNFNQDQDLYVFNRDLRAKYGGIEHGIEQDIEQVLGQERQAFADILQAVEAKRVIARCDLQGMNALLQTLFDLEGRLTTLRETIANSFYNIDIALNAIEDDAVVRVMMRLCEGGAAQRVFEAPGLLDGPVRSMVERERNHLLSLKSRVEELLGQQRDLAEAVRTKLRDLIGEFLRRCCGKERCSDTSRPSTGSSGRQPDANLPGDHGTSWPPGHADGRRPPAPPQDHSTPSKEGDWSFLPEDENPGTPAQPTPPPTPETGHSLGVGGDRARPIEPEPPGMPQPPETGARPPTGTTMGIPPQTGSGASLTQATFCCERCPGTEMDRLYFPLPPDTACQPGDVRRDDLAYPECGGNLLVEHQGPPTYGEACCAKKTAQLLYNTAKSGDVNSEVGATLRAACGDDPCAASSTGKPGEGPPSRLDVSILSTAPGPGGRNWVPEHPTLRVGHERLKPCHTESFYAIKETGTQGLAVAVMAALSIDEEDARSAEASEGTACSSGGHAARQRDTPQERAARAAAMSLLASQAKGQIEGVRATFDVTGREDRLTDARLEADLINEVTQHKSRLNLPMRFESSDASRP